MASKFVIKCTLDPASIDDAIRQLEDYRKSLEERCARLRELIGTRIAWRAAHGFSTALTSDIVMGGEPYPNDVSVSVANNGNVTVVIAEGEQAVFIEFGAGVYYNGSAGSSPHPWSAQNPTFLIGEYGKGFGKRNAWALPKEMWEETDKNGKPVPMVTRGTPAAMPMYHGVQDVLQVIGDLAMEVFGS